MNTAAPRKFKGTVDSASPAFQGLRAPAILTLIDRGDNYECQFVFVVGVPLALTVIAPKTGGSELTGTADDPRGWKVVFRAKLDCDRVTGTFQQPHDHGSFTLVEV